MRLISIFCFLLATFAAPAGAVPSLAGFQSLDQEIAALAAGSRGEFGIAAVDLQSGETVAFNGDTPFPMASTVKLAVAGAFLAQVDQGRRSLSDKIGGSSAQELIELMVIRSDNPATDILLRELGGAGAVDAWVRSLGLAGLRVDRTIAQLLRDRRNLRDVRDSSTPLAMLALLQKIDSGAVLGPESRSFLLGAMRRCATGSNRIRGQLPPGTPVEHKTGTLKGYTSDVGFITLPDGRRVGLVVFARGGTNRSSTIAAAARAIYDGFAAQTEPGLAFSRALSNP
jgi:beta-lactamase class A